MKNDLLKLIAAAIVLVVGVTAAQAQTTAGPNRPATVPARYVVTPFGYFDPSCVVSLASGDELLPSQNIIRHANGTTVGMHTCAYPHYRADGIQVVGDERGVTEPDISHAWVEAAPVTTTSSYAFLAAEWSVPPQPPENDGQILYYFPGLEDIKDVVTILQPVLGWNAPTSYGYFANAWGIASWNCCESGTTYVSTPVRANPGDTIDGYMFDTCSPGTKTCGTWDVVAWDLQSGQYSELIDTSNFSQTFNWAFAGVLEVYGVDQCGDYPNNPNTNNGLQNGISFNQVSLWNDKFQIIGSPAWSICKPGSKGSDCPILLSTTTAPQCNYGGSLPKEIILTY
jgi:hypothetical protein